MNILAINVISPVNIGDYAITQSLLQELERAFPESRITLSGFDSELLANAFKSCTSLPSVHYWSTYQYGTSPAQRLWRIPYGLLVSIACIGLRLPLFIMGDEHLKRITQAYRDADCIVVSGGGGIRCRSRINEVVNVILICHAVWLAKLAGKPVYWYSQSFGPLENKLARFVAKKTADGTRLFCAREDISVDYLKKYGVATNIVRTSDAAFLLSPPIQKQGKKTDRTIAVTVRQWLEPESQQKYEKAIAAIIDTLVKKEKVHIVIVPHVNAPKYNEDDNVVSESILKLVQNRDAVSIDNTIHSPKQAMQFFQKCELLIGTRMHSVILSLVSGTPAIAIEYEHKTGGIMKDLGLSEYVFKFASLDSDMVTKKASNLLKDSTEYFHSYKSNIGKLETLSRKAMDEIKKDFTSL